MDKTILCLTSREFREVWDVVWFNEFIIEIYNKFNLLYIEKWTYDMWNNTDQYFIETYGKMPDYIIGYEAIDWPNSKSKKILITEDLHHWEIKDLEQLLESIDIILPRFNIINNLFNNKFNNKIIEFPLYCNKMFFADNINYNSENKIITYGNLSGSYHLRLKWVDYMNNNYSDIFKHIAASSVNTSKTIRNYSFGLVVGYTPERFENINKKKNGYIVAKFYEILGSGLLLLADTTDIKEEFTKYGFEDNKNYIDISFDNIHQKIKFIIDPANSNKINEIRRNGYNFVKNNHLLNNRIETLQTIFKS